MGHTRPCRGDHMKAETRPTPSPAPAVDRSLEPPELTLPPIPPGFVPVNLKYYRGFHPKAGQVALLPDAIKEVAASQTYAATFGAAVPPAASLVRDLTVAVAWTNVRIQLEAFLEYVRCAEAVTWKEGLLDLGQLGPVFQLLLAQNPKVASQFPALKRLLDVPKVISREGVATRNRKRRAKAAGDPSGETG